MDTKKSHENIFKELKPILTEMGFNNAEYYSHFCSLNFTKVLNKVSYHIRLQFFNDSLGINYLQGHILLNEVNEMIGKFIDLKVNNEFITLKDYINKKKLTNKLREMNIISKNMNKSQYLIDIINHIKNLIIPFFNKYPDITAINEKILNKVPQKDYPEWFHGKSTLKILIIMKLCNNPKYNFYKASKEKEYLAFVNQNPAMWKPAYDTFCSLVEYLDKGHYNKTAIK